MRPPFLASFFLASVLLALGCSGGSGPVEPLPDLELLNRNLTLGPATCVTVDAQTHCIVDEDTPGAPVVFSGLDSSKTYKLKITGTARTNALTTNRYKFASVAIWYKGTGGAGMMLATNVGGTATITKPQGPVSVVLVDPFETDHSNNTGSLALDLSIGTTPVESKTLDPVVNCVSVAEAQPITGLTPGGQYSVRGAKDLLPPTHSYPNGFYSHALIAYETNGGMKMTAVNLDLEKYAIFTLRKTVGAAYAFFVEPDGGLAADNIGSAEICLEPVTKDSVRWGVNAKANHWRPQGISGPDYVFISHNFEQTTTVKWQSGLVNAATGVPFKQLLLSATGLVGGETPIVRTDIINKGQSVTYPAGTSWQIYATLVDEFSVGDNSGSLTLRVTDTGGRLEDKVLTASQHCILTTVNSVGALSRANPAGWPAFSVQPAVRNVFSWAGGDATYRGMLPTSVFPFERAVVMSTTAAGRQLHLLPCNATSSLSITPQSPRAYIFFTSSTTQPYRDGEISVRHKY